ncbi:Por secretion system C-terminal sorting domain-containing protein [Formosa sp. Hel1_31_208]|uniref:GEVED domain-containing protein n=1 Tax=Formosa sp. Hel1_31_208 TaxID=1798225 RepID=UPI00087A324E|nr:GEVED domain-containing protein [Formosa sp. Hel1_31_208]SDR65878.1 Por secretion system C-terminal sorting domain-containing protein [Formosa sp. Hel1_31_208]
MKRKLLLIIIVTTFVNSLVGAQVSIFSEGFETATGAENIASPYLSWQNGFFPTTPPTNNNFFWVFDNTRCNVISGNYSMAVSENSPVTTAPFPEYRTTRNAATLVYHTTPIDATNYTNLTLDFNWICEGEAGFDFGTVLYSLDQANWFVLPGVYQGQSTVQNVTNLDLSVLDGQVFYLAFGWENDGSLGNFPGFIIDDIDVQGILLSPCTTPNQPTVLNLTPTGDTINGSFTAAAPAPDNYLVVVSTNATAPNPTNGAAYNIGDTIGAGYTVVDNDGDTTFTATGLNPLTIYYLYVFSYNSACLGGPQYNLVNPLTGNTVTTNSTYCTPNTTNNINLKYINDVEFIGTLNDVANFNNNTSTTSNGYSDFTSLTNSVQAQGEGVNIYVGSNTGRGRYKAWVDWNKDGVFNNDASEIVYDSAGILTTTTTFGFVIPANQTIGDYRIRIRFNNNYRSSTGAIELGSYNFTACEPFDFVDNPGPNNDIYRFGEAEDYTFTVVESCTAKITSITDASTCGPGPVNLQVTGNASATIFNLYEAETGGNLIDSNNTGSFAPNIATTTIFWVTASDGSCESLKRLKIIGTVNPITELTITPGVPVVCGEDDIIEISATGDIELAYLIDEDFEGGGLGVFSVVNLIDNGPIQNSLTEWQNRTSTFVPSQQVWFPAISSGFGTNQFAMATSDVAPATGFVYTSMESPTVDSSTFTDLTLNFDMYFSKYLTGIDPDLIEIYVSTNGGATWALVQDYTDDIGYGTSFNTINIDLSAYINEPNLKISIDYIAQWSDGVAVDNIQLYGSRPLNPSFTWTGTVDAYSDAAATIPYVPGSTASSVYVRPTLTQLEQSTFTFTANATLSNGCTITKDITINNNTKIWNGSQGTSTWNDPDNWSPSGIPTSDNCVIVKDVGALPDPVLLGPPLPPSPAFARNLIIKNDGYLELESSTSLTVTDWITVEPTGIFDVRSGANLVQVTNVPVNNNTGSINMEREVTGLASNDYVYWSSAVENFGVLGVSPSSNPALILNWVPTIIGNGVGNYGEWQSTAENMIAGKGYAIRGLLGTATANTALFSGRPSNGIINRAISRGNYNGVDYPGAGSTIATAIDDNWNLVGNPFPSSISADDFISANAAIIVDDVNPAIAGTVYLWTHASAPSNAVTDPFYGDYVYNYNPNDYVAYNITGSTPAGFNGFIGAGQAFFVLMDNAAASPSNLLFDNTMRSGVYDNNQFYRTDSSGDDETPADIEKNRIWLDLINTNNQAVSTLVGYISGATNDKDRLYDGDQFSGSGMLFYSLINENKMVIQGRALPFAELDTVPLGFAVSQNGNYSIAINQVDGLFNTTNQDIFIEDTQTGAIHDLRLSPYTFSSEAGEFNNRFVLRYTDDTLSQNEVSSLDELEIIAPEGKYLKVTSQLSLIADIIIYDLQGKVVLNTNEVNLSEYTISTKHMANGAYIVKASLIDGKEKVQKVILNQ